MKLNVRSYAQLAAIVLIPVLIVFIFSILNTSSSIDTTVPSEPVTSNSVSNNEVDADEVVTNNDGTILSYNGEDGKTALELLKNHTITETEDSSFGEFVTSINGVDGGGSQYWLFYVNDEAATVGAGEYQTKNGDSIEWRLE